MKKRTVVAVARKLAVLLHRLWHQQEATAKFTRDQFAQSKLSPWFRQQRQPPTGAPLAAILQTKIISTAHGSRRRSSKLTNGNSIGSFYLTTTSPLMEA
jgi:hypothetical protein